MIKYEVTGWYIRYPSCNNIEEVLEILRSMKERGKQEWFDVWAEARREDITVRGMMFSGTFAEVERMDSAKDLVWFRTSDADRLDKILEVLCED